MAAQIAGDDEWLKGIGKGRMNRHLRIIKVTCDSATAEGSLHSKSYTEPTHSEHGDTKWGHLPAIRRA